MVATGKGAKGRSSKGKAGTRQKARAGKRRSRPTYPSTTRIVGLVDRLPPHPNHRKLSQGTCRTSPSCSRRFVQAGKIDLPPEALAILDATDKGGHKGFLQCGAKGIECQTKGLQPCAATTRCDHQEDREVQKLPIGNHENNSPTRPRGSKRTWSTSKDNLQKAERELEQNRIWRDRDGRAHDRAHRRDRHLWRYGHRQGEGQVEATARTVRSLEQGNGGKIHGCTATAAGSATGYATADAGYVRTWCSYSGRTTWCHMAYYTSSISRVGQEWLTAVASNPSTKAVLKGEHITGQGTHTISQRRQGGGCDEQMRSLSTEKYIRSHGPHGVDLHCIQRVHGSGIDGQCGSLIDQQGGQLPEEKNSPFEFHATGSGSSSLAGVSYFLKGRCYLMNVQDGHESFVSFDQRSEESFSDSSLVPENSNAKRTVLTCSGSPEDLIQRNDYFEPVTVTHANVIDEVFRHWHEKNVRGCTLDACIQRFVIWCKIDWGLYP